MCTARVLPSSLLFRPIFFPLMTTECSWLVLPCLHPIAIHSFSSHTTGYSQLMSPCRRSIVYIYLERSQVPFLSGVLPAPSHQGWGGGNSQAHQLPTLIYMAEDLFDLDRDKTKFVSMTTSDAELRLFFALPFVTHRRGSLPRGKRNSARSAEP